MPITTILLDAGGVILDESEHETVRAALATRIIRTVVPGYTEEIYYADIAESVNCFYPHAYKFVFEKRLGAGSSLFSELYSQYLNDWKRLKPPLKLSDGIDREIKELSREFSIAIAGQYGSEILSLLKEHSILDCFGSHLTQDNFNITKPDPQYYRQIAEAIGVKPVECIMIGDRIDKDIIPAKNVGMKTIRIRTGLHRNQEPRNPSEAPDRELNGVVGLAKVAFELAQEQQNLTM